MDNQLVSIPEADGQVALYHLLAERFYDVSKLTPEEIQSACRHIVKTHPHRRLGLYPNLRATANAVGLLKDQMTVVHGWAHLA